MNAGTTQRKIVRADRPIRAFTLIEMLICVGAVALIAVGLGKLFSATGATVKIGKRISYLNEVATTLERQIRADLAAATRDGPLVIRHKLMTNTIKLSGDDPAGRKRRVDQIVFFESGRFTSNREPQFPGRAPYGSAARVSIGHGMRRDGVNDLRLDDDPHNPATAAGWTSVAAPGLGEPGPNEFASDWILLRHVTVLARPQATQTAAAAPQTNANFTIPTALRNAWADSSVQIGLQPAAVSIFRFDPRFPAQPDRLGFGYEVRNGPLLANAIPQRILPPPGADKIARVNDPNGLFYPSFASGLVDVAAFDLPMVRTRILSVPDRLPFNGASENFPPRVTLTPTAAALAPNNALHLSKMLMAGLLPSPDSWIYDGLANQVASPTTEVPGQHSEQRMLCAPVPPDFTGNLSGGPYNSQEPYRQQDQAMLSASNLVVGCSEFIVEWSFGDVLPAYDFVSAPAPAGLTVGSLIWHGLTPSVPPPSGLPAAPYRADAAYSKHRAYGYDAFFERWTRTDAPPTPVSRVLPAAVIHWPANIGTLVPGNGPLIPTDRPLYSFFGYIDPTYDNKVSPPFDDKIDPDTLECPWPKLLRFTISLTDPTDPNVEKTYQFIVDLPAASRGQ